GVIGFTNIGYGTAGRSTEGPGVSGGSENGAGVEAESIHGPAVEAISRDGIGVVAAGGQAPLFLVPAEGAPPGAPNSGAHRQGEGGVGGSGGRGVQASGGAAQLRLVPASSPGHPSSGQMGDLFLDSTGTLFLCHGGTTWQTVVLSQGQGQGRRP